MTFLPPDPDAPESNQPAEPRLLTRNADVAPEPAQPRPKRPRRRSMRIILRTVLVLAILFIAAIVTSGIYLRHDLRAALPQIDGTLHTAGLSAPVTVTRDDHGVPSIQATNVDDLLFAQGFVTAQDRLWQMDALRRHAAGDLAEILGPSLVEHDRTQRTLQLRAAADRAVTVLPPDQLHQLDAYARGVNAFIAQNADRLPVDFHILHYTPCLLYTSPSPRDRQKSR